MNVDKKLLGKIFAAIGFICMAVLVVIIILNPDAIFGGPTQTEEPEPSALPQEMITMEEFNRIEMGMTYQEVVFAIGGEGELISENEIANIHTTMYKWDGIGYGNANVTFQDGVAVSKSQFGLE